MTSPEQAKQNPPEDQNFSSNNKAPINSQSSNSPDKKNIASNSNNADLPENIDKENDLLNKNIQNTSDINKSSFLYPRDHWVNLESLLERGGIVTKPTNLTLKILGIYSISDYWKKLESSGAVDSWPLQVKISDAIVSGGKINPRELTEEEKANADNKKKGPPKVDKKNPDAQKEEEEKLQKLKEEKELKEFKYLQEMGKLDPMERFYKYKEMHTTGDWISFPEDAMSNTVELSGEALLNMEDCINDKKQILLEVLKVPPPDENEKKRPKPKNMNPEDIKPINAVGLADLTEFYIVPGLKEVTLRTPLMCKETYDRRVENGMGKIVMDFNPNEMNLNPFDLEYIANNNNPDHKKVEEKNKADKPEEAQTNEIKGMMSSVPPEEELDYIEKAHTYVYYQISFSEPINPKLKGSKENAEPSDLLKTKKLDPEIAEILKDKQIEEIKEEEDVKPIPPEIKNQIIPNEPPKLETKSQILSQKENAQEDQMERKTKPIAPDEMCNDFRTYIKIFIASICKSFEEFMGDSGANQGMKRDKGGILSNVKKEERDANVKKFEKFYYEKGGVEMIKEKLKKFIIRIAIEKYKKRTNINQTFAESKDKFFSELYAYICDEIKLGMDEYMNIKKDEINDNILSSYEQSRKDILNYSIRKNKEPEEKKLLRLSNEYEILDDLNMATYYYKCRLTLVPTKESWLNYSILAKKMHNLVEVEESLATCNNLLQSQMAGNSYSIIQNDASLRQIFIDEFNFRILYSAIKYLKGRIKDAIGNLTFLINKYELKGTNCIFNAFLAFLYHEKGNNVLFTKHYEAAKRFKMIELGRNLKKPKVNLKIKTEYKMPTLEQDKCDAIWYSLIDMMNQYQFFEISDKLLQFITEENKSSIKYLLEKAKIYLYTDNTDDVIKTCDEILKREPQNYYAWMIRGHAYHKKKNLFDSEESYVSGIKCKPPNEKFDIKMLTRLGIIYIRRKTWEDAKTVFEHIIKINVLHSFAWRYLGLALTRLGDYIGAEEALSEAVLLDIENPTSWAYMCIFCIEVGRMEQAHECLKEIFRMNYDDIEIIKEIAELFHRNMDYETAAFLYKRINNIDPKYIDAYIKLSDIIYQTNKNDPEKKREAVNTLKNSLAFTTDEKQKDNIMELIAKIEKEIGEEGEMNITGESHIKNDNRVDGNDSIDQIFEK